MTNDGPSKRINTESLVVRHFDGTLNEEQEAELATALTTSSEAKQLFLSYMRMEGRLHSLGLDGFLREPVFEPALEQEESAPKSPLTTPLASSSQRRRFLFAASSVSVCATVTSLLLSVVLWPSSVSANSVLRKAQQAAAEMIDRTYRVTMSRKGEPSSMRELRVDVRGGGRFVFRPVDDAYVVGSNGTDYWLAHEDGPVWVTSKRRLLVPEMRQTMPNSWLFGIATNPKEPLLLQMAGLLSLMEQTGDVKLIRSASASEYHVRATLRSGPPNAPEKVDFWADKDSGVALRAEVSWSDGRQMRFEMVESDVLSDEWYHYSEHTPGRKVRRLPAGDRS